MNPRAMLSFEEELGQFQQKDLYRKLRILKDENAVKVFCENRELTVFCGNDYLGLSHDLSVVDAMKKAADTHGAGSGASRLISGTSDWHQKLEEELAAFKNKESALVYTAGYLANLGVLSALAGKTDRIVMDKLCHASLIDAARLSGAEIRVFPHLNYERCEELLATAKPESKVFLVSDTVFSMDGDLADIESLVRLKKKYGAFLILDDAHGTGVFGKNGSGAVEGFEKDIDVITGTLSKALGAVGGFAITDSLIREYLINTSRPFIFATSLPPAICAAAHESLRQIRQKPALREMLWQNVREIYQGMNRLGWDAPAQLSPIIPVMIGAEKEAVVLSEKLLEKGFLIPAIRTPTVAKGKARLRLTVSAAHTPAQIQSLLETLKTLLQKKP